jgi:hypothetical protein
MPQRWERALGLLCAWAGALVWAIALTVFEPETEPAKPWHDRVASNNDYWARDLRWMAILVVLVAMVLLFRGNRRRSWLATVGTAGWFGLDLYLDRIDVAGWAATLLAVGVAWAAIAAAVFASGRRGRRVRCEPGHDGVGNGGPAGGGTGRPEARSLAGAVAIAIAAALAPVAGSLQSSTDAERGLAPSALAVGGLFAVLAMACALSVAPAMNRRRMLAAAGVVVLTIGCLVAQRLWDVDPSLQMMAVPATVVLTGAIVLSRSWPIPVRGWVGCAMLAALTLIGYPKVLLVAFVSTSYVVPVGALATALAGNPPVNGADTDALLSLTGLIAGLVFGGALLLAAQLVTQLGWKERRRPGGGATSP